MDVVIGGSPCQDLSIAGKRAGLSGARSGLYMEQIRIIKEMRERDMASGRTDEFVRPRYMVWENVPGAFSSNGGKDFAAVLEEAIRIAEPEAPDIEVPEKGWNTWGGYHDEMGGRWSVAWRVLDAQHWGVPQRRRRIALVADFGGDTAWEISFEQQSMSGYPAESGAPGEGPAGDSERGACGTGKDAGSVICLQGNAIDRAAVCAGMNVGEARAYSFESLASNSMKSKNPSDVVRECGSIVPTLTARGGTGGGNVSLVADVGFLNCYEDTSPTLLARTYKDPHIVVFSEKTGSICAESYPSKLAHQDIVNGCYPTVQNGVQRVVRRLTPLECERLQGFPDHWTDLGEWTDSKGKRHKDADSPRYKALGNSIALPPWKWLLKRLCGNYGRDATMASLFDGIGGFPLIWEQLNGRGTCLWASEIEEFPIAVTKRRFGTLEEPGDMGRFLFPCGKDKL